jgi:hypothetical protein
MARYIGAAVAVALIATVYNSVTNNHGGASNPDALATGLAGAGLVLAIFSGVGVALSLLMARHRPGRPTTVQLAAAAAATSHTIPTAPVPHT